MRQVEVSRTVVLDDPRRARAFFESLVADNIGIGRPNQVAAVFARRVQKNTPGIFRTRVFGAGTEVKVDFHYKKSRVKQYLKEGRAIRIETVINDPADIAIKRRLVHLPELQEKARAVNHRLLLIERAGQGCTIGSALFEHIQLPYVRGGQRTGALRFGDPRVMALAGALCLFVHAVAGFTNKSLRCLVAELLAVEYSPGQMTYDLRRLRLHGLVERLPHSNTYVLTAPTSSRPPACASPCSTPKCTGASCGHSSPPTTSPRHPSCAPLCPRSTAPWPTTSQTPASKSPLDRTCHIVPFFKPQEKLGAKALLVGLRP